MKAAKPAAELKMPQPVKTVVTASYRKGPPRMPRFTFSLSRTVRYNVFVEAPTRMDAFRKLVGDLQAADGDPIDLYEIDNDGLTIDVGPMDASDNIDLRRQMRRPEQKPTIQRGYYSGGRRKEARRHS